MTNKVNLPQWKCHKVVRAAKIIGCVEDSMFQKLKLDTEPVVEVPLLKGTLPDNSIGGYYVVYEDGYTSFSPAEAFEAGYTLIKEPPPSDLQPHQQRVVKELRELDERLKALTEFTASAQYCVPHPTEREDLATQRIFMRAYASVLKDRVARFSK